MLVNGTTMADAAARWYAAPRHHPRCRIAASSDACRYRYFGGSVEKIVDGPFPGNPTCGDGERWGEPVCSNCANRGLGSNCLWDGSRFHGELVE